MIVGAAALVVVFYLARYLFTRFTGRSSQANVVAGGVVLFVLIVGLAIVYFPRSSSDVASQVPAPAVDSAPAPPVVNVSLECRKLPKSIAKSGNGYLDGIVSGTSTSGAVTQTGTMRGAREYSLIGWGVSHDDKSLARAVCLMVDGRPSAKGTSLYGVARPDVATTLNDPALLGAGYRIELPPKALSRGKHRLSVVIVSQDGSAAYAVNSWAVTVI